MINNCELCNRLSLIEKFLEAITIPPAIFFATFDAPVLLIASSASSLGFTSHAITCSLSSLSSLKKSSSSGSSSKSCSRGLTEAGITSASNLLTSHEKAGAVPLQVFLASRRCKSCRCLDWSFSSLHHPWSWLRLRLIPLGFWELNLVIQKISSRVFAFFLPKFYWA